jgi:hypothetical protein
MQSVFVHNFLLQKYLQENKRKTLEKNHIKRFHSTSNICSKQKGFHSFCTAIGFCLVALHNIRLYLHNNCAKYYKQNVIQCCFLIMHVCVSNLKTTIWQHQPYIIHLLGNMNNKITWYTQNSQSRWWLFS